MKKMALLPLGIFASVLAFGASQAAPALAAHTSTGHHVVASGAHVSEMKKAHSGAVVQKAETAKEIKAASGLKEAKMKKTKTHGTQK